MIAAVFVGSVLGIHLDTYENFAPSDVHPTVAPDGVLYAPTGGAYNASVVAINPDGSTKWKHKFDDVADSSYSLMNSLSPPALSLDGATLYITGTDGFLHALNTHDGAIKWKFEDLLNESPDVETCWFGDGVVCPLFQQVLVDEMGTLYFKGGQTVYALPSSYGASSTIDDILWKFDLSAYYDDYFLSMHMELSEGALYIQSYHHFIALNVSNGDALWFQPASEYGYPYHRVNGDAPRVAQDGLLYGYTETLFKDGSDLVTINQSNVTVLRHFDETGQYRLATQGDTIFVSTASSVHATHMDGTDKWAWTASNQLAAYMLSSPVICRDVLYVAVGPSSFPGNGTLQALNVSTGTPLWSVSPNFTSIYYQCDSCGCDDEEWSSCCDFCTFSLGVTPSCSHDGEVIYFGVSAANRFLLTSAIAANGSVLWAFSDWDMPITI